MIDIEKLEKLPYKEGTIKPLKVRNEIDGWGVGTSDYHNVGDYSPYTIIERVLTKFYKKSVNKAFSYYCTLVPKYQQKFFWENFESVRRYRWFTWYLDSQGRVQNKNFEKDTKKHYVIRSQDFLTETRHRVTGHLLDHFKAVKKEGANYWDKPTHYVYVGGRKMKPLHEQYTALPEDFAHFIVRGWEEVFNSKEDPRYKRLFKEQEQQIKAQNKLRKQIQQEKEYCMLSNKELEIKKLSEQDIIKRDRHGFDENSFKGEEYHGQKRKKK